MLALLDRIDPDDRASKGSPGSPGAHRGGRFERVEQELGTERSCARRSVMQEAPRKAHSRKYIRKRENLVS